MKRSLNWSQCIKIGWLVFFFHLLQDKEGAEDLAQEAFLRIYRARETYKPTAKFSTWLFRIANNLVSNSRRSKGRRREVALNLRDSGPLGPRPEEKLIAEKSALMPTRQVAKSEMQAEVQKAMDSLPDRQKMALNLHKFEGMSYADIGEAMGLTPAAVKSLLSRAREKCQSQVGTIREINRNLAVLLSRFLILNVNHERIRKN